MVKSAGTEQNARIRITEKLLTWAELIFVMEKRHKDRILEKFGTLPDGKELVVLEIPDDYGYMDSELIDMLNVAVAPYLDESLKQ